MFKTVQKKIAKNPHFPHFHRGFDEAGMSNKTCPTRHVQPKNDMSEETRRSFIRSSVAKTLLAANAGVIAGLINTPGFAGAGGGAESSGPATTLPKNENTLTTYHTTGDFPADTEKQCNDAFARFKALVASNKSSLATSANKDGPHSLGMTFGTYPVTVYSNSCASNGPAARGPDGKWHIPYTITSKQYQYYYIDAPE